MTRESKDGWEPLVTLYITTQHESQVRACSPGREISLTRIQGRGEASHLDGLNPTVVALENPMISVVGTDDLQQTGLVQVQEVITCAHK